MTADTGGTGEGGEGSGAGTAGPGAAADRAAGDGAAGDRWRLTVPAGWVVWVPGSPDVPALRAAATTTKRAGLTLTQGIGVIEKELEKVHANVVQVGVRAADPRSGTVTGSMRLTHWPRPVEGGKALNAKQHLDALRKQGQDGSRLYQHHEHSIVTVPSGQAVLSNEIWRKKWGIRTMMALAVVLFARGTDSVYRLEVTSRYGELQPELMADLSLMAHSFTVEAP